MIVKSPTQPDPGALSRLENEFEISDRGEFEVKGFGMQHLWSLEAEFTDRQGRHH